MRIPREIAGDTIMETIRLAYPLTESFIEQNARPQVLAIGQFDGLHLGHASVIDSAVRLAGELGLPASVMTFHPHPKEVMKKGDYDGYLTLRRRRSEFCAIWAWITYISSNLTMLSPE
ncbi:hypothetical protein HMSSN139_62820 [Paenibacillus sp. HMSSN-139]|nr:hypothetical protein HMSSN139_62820 [Paenibacillus sp. HMSSN-139]